MESHQAVFDQIFQNLSRYNLVINLHKSIFAREKLNYLGFVASGYGYSATNEKIKAVVEYLCGESNSYQTLYSFKTINVFKENYIKLDI